MVTIAKEVIWKTKGKGMKTGTFIFGSSLVNYFVLHLKRKVGLERRCLSAERYKKLWMIVERKSGKTGAPWIEFIDCQKFSVMHRESWGPDTDPIRHSICNYLQLYLFYSQITVNWIIFIFMFFIYSILKGFSFVMSSSPPVFALVGNKKSLNCCPKFIRLTSLPVLNGFLYFFKNSSVLSLLKIIYPLFSISFW